MHKLSVTIITHQEEENIARCLDSVKDLADEIVVVDSNSTDRTVEICRSYGCRVYIRDFEGYGKQKQFAVDQAVYDWIFSLDADEEITEKLKSEIRVLLQKDKIDDAGYRVPEAFCYMGKILRHSRTFPLRLFDRRRGAFSNDPVHEKVVLSGTTGKMKGKMIHYSYRDISHHLQKINSYTTHAALANAQRRRKYSKCWVAFKFPVSFFIFYVIRLGILDGYPGFLWSFFAAFYGSLKIAKTIEMENKK